MKLLNRLTSLFAKQQQPIDVPFVSGSKHFCMMPFVHVHVTQYGTVTPCCQTPWQEDQAFGNVNKQTIAEIWQGEAIQAFRKTMKTDAPDSRCERCYGKEKAGLYSLRKSANTDYLHHVQRVNEDSSTYSPVYFDFRFSNFCNFRCRICGPWSSSKWFNEAEELGMSGKGLRLSTAIEDEPAFFKDFEQYIASVEEIYFAGGEPLLMEQHYTLLDLLLIHGKTNVLLRYNTNFSTFSFRGKSIYDYWNQFSNVFVCASLDGTEKRGEYQRKEQDWSEVVKHIQVIRKECPHIDLMIAPTVNVFSAFHLPDFHREWVEKKWIDVSEFFPSVLEEPKMYNIKIFTSAMKAKLAEKYREHIKWIARQSTNDQRAKDLIIAEFESCVRFMLQEDFSNQVESFKQTTLKLDVMRNESVLDVFPELKPLFY